MTNHYRNLLWCVLENPLDDAPRLVMADWLEENGYTDRSEYIRLGIELARRFGVPSDDTPVATGDRVEDEEERQLWKRYREVMLLREEPEVLVVFGYPITFSWRRGFVEGITLGCGDFMAHAAELFSLFPILDVKLADKGDGDSEEGPEWHAQVFGIIEPEQCPGCLPSALNVCVRSISPCVNPRGYSVLSRGCVAYGRAAAGLPPLEVNRGQKV